MIFAACFKALFLSLALFFLNNIACLAQNVTFRKETIYLNAKRYAFLEKSGSAWELEFTLTNLAKEELVHVKPVSKQLAQDFDLVYYELRFKGFAEKAEMQDDDDFIRILAYEFGKFRILKNDSLDAEAVKGFLEKYPAGKFSDQFSKKPAPLAKPTFKPEKSAVGGKAAGMPNQQQSAASVNASAKPTDSGGSPAVQPLVPADSAERPLPAAVLKNKLNLNGNAILKGKKTIATYAVSEKKTGGQLKTVILVSNLKNRKIATLTLTAATPGTGQLYTFKDKKNQKLALSGQKDAPLSLVGFLLKNGYL